MKQSKLYKGIFWIKDGKIISKKCSCDKDGKSKVGEEPVYSSKSGDSFNHKKEWGKLDKTVTGRKPFDYYPRGRVEIKPSKITVYMCPQLFTEENKIQITEEFGLTGETVTFKADGSEHYRPKLYDAND